MRLIFKVYISLCHVHFNTSHRALDVLQIYAQTALSRFVGVFNPEVLRLWLGVEHSHCFQSLVGLTVAFVKCCSLSAVELKIKC